jgi:1-acyl-sn-glycerol-3-phosphate acyltransferase
VEPRRPTDEQIARAMRLLRPWRRLTSPRFTGLDQIPAERPLLFVGNHTLFGILDVPLMIAELWEQKHIYLRALGDHAHFKIPLWRDFMTQFGVVDGTRDNCRRLMEAGESILVFPGGGREVAKRKGEKYQLLWKERLGFARMAIRHRCTIVPFAAVGVEDSFDIVADAEDILATPLGKLIRGLRIRPEVVPPVAVGIGRTPLPRPERYYFSFGAPISTAVHEGRDDDEERCRAVRDATRAAVEAGITELRAYREIDPDRPLLARLFDKKP